ALTQLSRLDDIRALVIRGEGPAFSVGADISAFLAMQENYGSTWMQKGRMIAHDMQAVVNRLQRLEIPSIAVIHGYCLGMGLELALACDFRIASDDARLGLPETLLGLIPDVGGTTRLTKLIGPTKAKELIFTGRQINAQTAEKLGIVSQVVSAAELPATITQWTNDLSKASGQAIGIAKRIIDGMDDSGRGFDLEGWAQTQLYASADFQKSLQTFAEKRSSK
ncbi:MAG: enoyl-CoA hydratase/isomerase family protein, partial [Proteobacteria bacterium]|nr:enoyl-CoA hydratase/isomerase family protein [Pseudomonadota bacterium]